MSVINDKHRHSFIHIPKCAGNSMQSENWVGNKCHTTVKDFIENGKWREDYFSWTFVRNPFDRLLSSYFWVKREKYIFKKWHDELRQDHCEDFSTFVHWLNGANIEDDVLLKPQHLHITYDGTIRVNFIGRFENLSKDWPYVTNKVIGKKITLSHKNKTSHKHYTEYYNKELKQIAYNRYKKDFEIFNYESR